MKKHILFISTHNLATNPRLVKEIDLALENHYEVSVLCCTFDNWSQGINEGIINRLRNKIHFYLVPGNRNPLAAWIVSSFVFSLAGMALEIFPRNSLLLSLKSNKRSFLLLQHLKKIKEKIDLVIAHNPGSFYPAMHYAGKNKIPFGIDLEDYHPGETTGKKNAGYLKNLLKKIVSKADYLSAASPLILQYSLKDIGIYKKPVEVIMNWFPSCQFQPPFPITNPVLQLVWFSQNIAAGRGLEQVVPVIKEYEDEIRLTMYGNIQKAFFIEWIKGVKNIVVHPAMPQNLLHKELARYDIGLAIEPGKDLNNELAISNKMLAYLQAGLLVIASNTMAQKRLCLQFPDNSLWTDLCTNDFKKTIEAVLKQKENMRLQKQKRCLALKDYCWENESKKLLLIWNDILT